MNKGVSKFLKSVSVKTDDGDGELRLPYSATCEIPGCDTLFVPAGNGYPDRHERGKTAVTVEDFGGVKRGICAEHYLRGLVKAGKHSLSHLRNYDGSMSEVLVREHWAKMDEEAKK